MATYDHYEEVIQAEKSFRHSQNRKGRPLPMRPSLDTRINDTLRLNKNTSKIHGGRSESLYNKYYTDEHVDFSECGNYDIEDQFMNVSTVKIAECNTGPLIRKRKVRNIENYKSWTLDDVVHAFNNEDLVATSKTNVDLTNLEQYIKFDLLQQLEMKDNIHGLLVLMKANNYSIKFLVVQSIQTILFNRQLYRLSDEECKMVFVDGLTLLFEELFSVKNNYKSAVLVEVLILEFLACIFIWMLNSQNTVEVQVAIDKLLQEKLYKKFRSVHKTSLPEKLFESLMVSAEMLCSDLASRSHLRIAEWDKALRDETTRHLIVAQFSTLSFIEQITCTYLLANVTVRRENFDNTLELLDECIKALKTTKNVNDPEPLLFFMDWIATNLLTFYADRTEMHSNRQQIEKVLLKILEKVNDMCKLDKHECLLFHQNVNIRTWLLQRCIIQQEDKESEHKLVQFCNQHVERLLLKCNLEVNMSEDEVTGLQYQPVWAETKCRLFGDFGRLIILYPSVKCLGRQSFSDYKEAADTYKTNSYMNELDILTKVEDSGGHENIIELIVHQSIPYPLFYIVFDHSGENLQSFLLRRRLEKNPIPLKTLLEIILQALKAVDFLNGKGIVHRNITASSFIQRVDVNNHIVVQMADLKLARLLWKEGEQPRRELVDLQCNDIPSRWSAPETLTKGIFSRRSDSWMTCMLAVEVLEHGRWPLTDNENTTAVVMENMLFNDVRVQQQVCTPKEIHTVILDGTEIAPSNRIGLADFEAYLIEFTSRLQAQTTTEVYNSAAIKWKSESIMPKLSKIQVDMKSVPEKGIPSTIRDYRKTDEDPEDIYHADRNIRRAEKHVACLVVTDVDLCWADEPRSYYEAEKLFFEEKVFEPFVKDVWPKLSYLRNDDLLITPWPPQPVKMEQTCEDEFILRYSIPQSSSLLEACMRQEFGHTIDEYLEIIYRLALLVDSFHEEGWLLNCLRAKNIRISSDKKVFIPRLGRFIHNRSATFHCDLVQHDIPLDMKRWLPLETIENDIVSIYSDSYSFGMLMSEICAILAEKGPRYEEDIYDNLENPNDVLKEIERNCAPFGHIHTDQLGTHLKEGHIPKKHDSCPAPLYDIMVKCWEIQPLDRPTMKDITQDLKHHVKNHAGIVKPVLKSNTSNNEVLYNRPAATNGRDTERRIIKSEDQAQSTQYSYSTSRSASGYDDFYNKPSDGNSQTLRKCQSTSSISGCSTGRSGRIRQKKKRHPSILGTSD